MIRRSTLPRALLSGLAIAFASCLAVAHAKQPSTRPADGEGEVFTRQGVEIRVTGQPGEERQAREGDVLMVHYTGRLEDGTVFDTSRQIRPRQRESFPVPLMLRLGEGQVIRGWRIGLEGMSVGERRRLVIPPELAYGERGFPPVIPPNATLTFDLELVGLARPQVDLEAQP